MLQVLLAIVLCTLGAAAGAHPEENLIELSVYDLAEGRTLPVYRHEGRRYVAGRPGNAYLLTLRNRADTDLLAVVSVDGVNVISGETASWEQAGYVVPARGKIAVRGWRKSLSSVASFFFTSHANAYATRIGRPLDVGVIGVAVFRARAPELGIAGPQDAQPQTEAGPAARPDGAANDAAHERAAPPLPEREGALGTGHGRSQVSWARHTTFQRASAAPSEVVAIRYDTHANLTAMGVIRPLARRVPSPFPGRFVPDPN